MLEKIKNIADWWGEKNSAGKVHLLYLAIIIGMAYLNYTNGKRFKSDMEDCRTNIKQLKAELYDNYRRFDDYRMRTDSQIQKMQEDANHREIEINERYAEQFQTLFEAVDRIYQKRQVR